MPNLVPFLTYVLITTFTPGPNNIMSMFNAGKNGLKKAIKFNVGIFFGFTVVMGVCGVFSSIILGNLPAIKPIMKYIGAGYILWLAYKTYTSIYNADVSGDVDVYGIKEGFLLQFVNPKVILYGITTLSTFVLPYFTYKIYLVGFSIGFAFLAFVATASWAIFGSVFHKFITSRGKLVNTVMALILLYTAIELING